MDKVCIRHLQSMDVSLEIIAADALDVEAMSQLIVHAHEKVPMGRIFLMTVISRDRMFSGMKQESFDDVYLFKVIALNILLRLVYPAALDSSQPLDLFLAMQDNQLIVHPSCTSYATCSFFFNRNT